MTKPTGPPRCGGLSLGGANSVQGGYRAGDGIEIWSHQPLRIFFLVPVELGNDAHRHEEDDYLGRQVPSIKKAWPGYHAGERQGERDRAKKKKKAPPFVASSARSPTSYEARSACVENVGQCRPDFNKLEVHSQKFMTLAIITRNG